ncbi:TlpA disulfide reductase family protein [Mucilaginibacter sp. AK015]|uniref:TlpA family protein disulfide reductase n=1 Tax=Mucilaginibacter sp. AK015 TaxID=2723072 RepID=UPI00160786E5|nr:TlpA disulfide reductase family protein [Mucilaginibacter sp. AK015]MBB5395180.1 thiol-disulfide isomerase/thioredoxin [Mucilaginibacter sp. AK015]
MRILIPLMGCLFAQTVFAQRLTLTGTTKRGTTVELNETYDGNYWKKQAVLLQADGAGHFKKYLIGTSPKWVWIGDEANRKWVLLSPGRPLQLSLRQGDISFSGTAARENQLIAKLGLESVQHLTFVKELAHQPSYATASVDSFLRYKLPLILKSLDSTRKVVRHAGLPKTVTQTILSEVNCYYACGMTGDLVYWLNQGKNRRDFHLRFIDTLQAHFPVPSAAELALSPAANLYLERLFRLRVWKLIYTYQSDPDKRHADSVFFKATGLRFEALKKEVIEKGNEMLVFSTRLKALLPGYAWEKWLNNALFGASMSGRLQDSGWLLQFIQRNTRDSNLVAQAVAMYAPLKKARDKYAANLNIRIRPDYRQVNSVESLLAPYKGKVVFIDLWGTWCPHCIEDMAYEPSLKKRLEGKDVVFLYVAQDEDRDDEKWRDFIFVNNVVGEHVRKSADEIGMLWNALGIAEKDWAYPHYLIADRSGKIVVKSAERPGEGDGLYQQLTEALR